MCCAGPDSAAQSMLADIRKGVDFQKLAQERSSDRALSQGVESRYLDRLDAQAKLNPELEETIFSLKVGVVSPAIRTNQGSGWSRSRTGNRCATTSRSNRPGNASAVSCTSNAIGG